MNSLESWITSGRIIDVVLVFVALEVAAMVIWRRRHHLSIGRLVSLIAPGLAIFMALGAALRGDATWIIAAWMLASLAAHLLDLRLRVREAGALVRKETSGHQ